jgi:Fe-S-cluster-containing dehydrogenase component
VFGDLDDPEGRIAQLIHDRQGFELLEELGTKPAVRYLPPRRRAGL